MNKFIFDVDGTLTPSRGKIDKEFKEYFLSFCLDNEVYLVTGSDRAKTVEQIGEDVVNKCKRVYNCSGSDVWEKDVNVQTSEWTVPADLHKLFDGWLQSSKFPLRTGTHVEQRPGMANFSIVGRGATQDQRQEYVAWDTANRERETIAFIINNEFDNITATIGGETGIDIAPIGADKSQILKDFKKTDHIKFFGDAIFEGGNDWPLALALTTRNANYNWYKVKDWRDTWERLSYLQEAKLAG